MDEAKPSVATEIKQWFSDIDAAIKREDDYRKDGKELWEIYDGKRKDQVPFNILFSNTEILVPALYAAVPRPIVGRRFKGPKDNDPLTLAVAEASTRMLMFLRDTNSEEYDDFDTVMQENVLDACVPGRGLMELCYDGKTAEVPVQGQEKPSEQLVSECVYPESCIWNRYVFGYAKKWKDVPWVAFELYFDKPDAKKEFGAIADKLIYLPEGEQEKDDKGEPSPSATTQGERRKVARVWKIWDKKKRSLCFISKGCEEYLKEEEDPYKLTGFFPFPKPLRLVAKSSDLKVTAPYKEYENQATELNNLTVRINNLIKMCKVRGVYDAKILEIENLLEAEDGNMQPTSESSTLSREGGLDKHIWLMPIDKVVVVIQQLYLARTQCKQVIYEIMGLADIMRGASQASETLGAQKLKAQFGSVRMKRSQREVARYARDCFRVMLEMAISMFQPDMWAKATGLPYLTDEQFAQAQQAMTQAKAAAMQAQAAGQPAPPPDPALVQALQTPKWSDILRILKDDVTREYKVDIETNSTIDPDASENKQNISELMNAMSQFLNGVSPLVMEGALPMDAAKAMLLGVTRQFEFGAEVEDFIRNMQQPPPKPPQEDKSAQLALQGQLQKSELEKAGLQQKSDLEKQKYDLGLREADLRTKEAAHSAREEIYRIQTTAHKASLASENKQAISQHKQLTDGAVGEVKRIAAELTAQLKNALQARDVKDKAAERIHAVQTGAAESLKSFEPLIKQLIAGVENNTKTHAAKKVKKFIKDPKTGKNVGLEESLA